MPFDRKKIKVESGDGLNVVLLEAFTYVTNAGEAIVVPAGTESDGASTPRLMWREIPPFGQYWMPAVFHDFLYRDSDKAKEECDRLFLEAMESLGVAKIERDAIYEGVNLFGWKAFRADRTNRVMQTGTLIDVVATRSVAGSAGGAPAGTAGETLVASRSAALPRVGI